MKAPQDDWDSTNMGKSVPFVNGNQVDYTEWQRQHFDTKSPEQIDREAKEYVEKHPFEGKDAVIL